MPPKMKPAVLPGYHLNDATALATVRDVVRFVRGLPETARTRMAIVNRLEGVLSDQGFNPARRYRLVAGAAANETGTADIMLGGVAILVDTWPDDVQQFTTRELYDRIGSWCENDLVREVVLLTCNPNRGQLRDVRHGKTVAVLVGPAPAPLEVADA